MIILKDKINRILGNNARLLLPSYWWKRAFGLIVDELVPKVSSEKELESLDVENGTIATVRGMMEKSFRECYYINPFDEDVFFELLCQEKLTRITDIKLKDALVTDEAQGVILLLNSSGSAQVTFGCTVSGGVVMCEAYTFNLETEEREEIILRNGGVVNQSGVDRLNAILANTPYYFVYVVYNNMGNLNSTKGFDYIDKFYSWGGSGVEAYIKGKEWERLAKESDLEGVGASIIVDSELSDTSTNVVQNKVVTEALGILEEHLAVHSKQISSLGLSMATKEELNNKVDKVSGKQLSTEDFTSALKAKLEGLSNYDDTPLSNAISGLETRLNTLVSGDASAAIESFNEIIAFLNGVEDSENLDSIIASIEQQIAAKQDSITDLGEIRRGAGLGATAIQKVKTINGESITGDGNVEIFTKAMHDELVEKMLDNEEVTATSYNELNDRIEANYQHGEETYATITSLAEEVAAITTTIVENEEVTAATLNDLLARIDALTTRIEILENA